MIYLPVKQGYAEFLTPDGVQTGEFVKDRIAKREQHRFPYETDPVQVKGFNDDVIFHMEITHDQLDDIVEEFIMNTDISEVFRMIQASRYLPKVNEVSQIDRLV